MQKKNLAISLIILTIVLLLGVVFWGDIVSTGISMYTKYHLRDNPVINVVPESYTLQPSQPTNPNVYTFKNLTLKIPFKATNEKVSPESLVVNGPEKSAVYIRESVDFSELFTNEACSWMPPVNNFNVCGNSNYERYSAILFTSGNNVHLYSSRAEKMSFSVLGVLKSTYVSSNEPSKKFETSNIRGYMFTHENAITVSFFDKNDTYYELLLSNISQADADYILSTVSSI